MGFLSNGKIYVMRVAYAWALLIDCLTCGCVLPITKSNTLHVLNMCGQGYFFTGNSIGTFLRDTEEIEV